MNKRQLYAQQRYNNNIISVCANEAKTCQTSAQHAHALHSHHSRVVGLFLDGYADGVLGQQFLDEFRPFYETGVAAVEIVIDADVVGLTETLDTVEVKVIDGTTFSSLILVDNGEGGTVDRVGHAQCLTDSLDERRLARTHGGVEGKDGKGTVGGAVVQSEMGYELSGSLANLSEGFDDDVHDDIL